MGRRTTGAIHNDLAGMRVRPARVPAARGAHQAIMGQRVDKPSLATYGAANRDGGPPVMLLA